MEGWTAARALAPKGGAVELLGPVNLRLKALDAFPDTSARYAEIAIRAAVSAAQEERDELALLLAHARDLSNQMELIGSPAQWPLPIDELEGRAVARGRSLHRGARRLRARHQVASHAQCLDRPGARQRSPRRRRDGLPRVHNCRIDEESANHGRTRDLAVRPEVQDSETFCRYDVSPRDSARRVKPEVLEALASMGCGRAPTRRSRCCASRSTICIASRSASSAIGAAPASSR